MRYEERFNDQYTLVYRDEREISFIGHLKEKLEVHSRAKTKEELKEFEYDSCGSKRIGKR